jgi:hypothetical protein
MICSQSRKLPTRAICSAYTTIPSCSTKQI